MLLNIFLIAARLKIITFPSHICIPYILQIIFFLSLDPRGILPYLTEMALPINFVQYNLDYLNTLVIWMTISVRVNEINIKSMRDDFHLILQNTFIFVSSKLKILIDEFTTVIASNCFPRKLFLP